MRSAAKFQTGSMQGRLTSGSRSISPRSAAGCERTPATGSPRGLEAQSDQQVVVPRQDRGLPGALVDVEVVFVGVGAEHHFAVLLPAVGAEVKRQCVLVLQPVA